MPVSDEKYIQRCFDLARLAAGQTSPNPVVGAVLVYQDRIIGEGFHSRYGYPHAEVEAVRSVVAADRHLIPLATLYVSLEPCSVYGRTPPCTDLIIRERIHKVVISYIDHSPGVNGQGVALLRANGIEVIENVLSEAGKRLAQARNTFVRFQRPYIVLKYACSSNGYLAPADGRQLWLSNAYSKRLVHRWRAEVDAILVGPGTALADNPQLNTRFYPGRSPIRVVPDRHLKVPTDLYLFDDSVPTLIFTIQTPPAHKYRQTVYIRLQEQNFVEEMLRELHRRNIQQLMVEGGQVMLGQFIQQGFWDEARVFITPHFLPEGLAAPHWPMPPVQRHRLATDCLEVYRPIGS